MGRSFWIMDDVTPLRQMAAAQRARLTLLQPVVSAIRYRRGRRRPRQRRRSIHRVALAIDYVVPEGFTGPLTLEITDAPGPTGAHRRHAPAAGQARAGTRCRRRRRTAGDPDMAPAQAAAAAAAAPLTTQAGPQPLLWDYRWANNGPLAAPGQIPRGAAAHGSAGRRRAAGDRASSRCRSIPACCEDGIDGGGPRRAAELPAAGARRDRGRRTGCGRARSRRWRRPTSSRRGRRARASRVDGIDYAHPLQRIWARLVTAPGIYEQGMLIDQLGNIVRAEGGADQKVGAESRRRLDDLLDEMKAIEAELGELRR